MKCLIAMAAAAMALAAVAQGPDVHHKPRPPHAGVADPILRVIRNPKVAQKIGLSEEQQTKLNALADDKEEVKDLQEKVRKGMERQAELLKAEKIDEAAVMAAIDDVFEARKEVARHQTKRLIAVKSILTPEQVKAATEAFQAMKAKRFDKDEDRAERPKKGGPVRPRRPKHPEEMP